MAEYGKICEAVCGVARRAGEFIARERETFSFDKVEFKGTHDLVSYVDKGAEKIIVDALREIMPQAGFIAEEGTAAYNGEEYAWVIDPLDGTTNFVHGLPPYCVSIALMKGKDVVVGVVYEITLQEMFCAWQGSQAYLNGKPVKASSVDKLDNALIAVGFSHAVLPYLDREMERMAYYQRNSDGIRRIGSAAADLVYVACGRFDAFEQVKLSPWDVAAGVFIAQRAGAVVSDLSGGDNCIFGEEVVAANPLIYDEFMKSIRE